jgi:hypothetical protein
MRDARLLTQMPLVSNYREFPLERGHSDIGVTTSNFGYRRGLKFRSGRFKEWEWEESFRKEAEDSLGVSVIDGIATLPSQELHFKVNHLSYSS